MKISFNLFVCTRYRLNGGRLSAKFGGLNFSRLYFDSISYVPSGRASKSNILTYQYQHAETQVMNAVRAELAQRDMQVLANIHDAIIVHQRLSADDRWLIEQKMTQSTGNDYWSLSERRVDGFKWRNES